MINVKPAIGGIEIELISETERGDWIVSREFVPLDKVDGLKQSIFDARREAIALRLIPQPA